MGWLFPILTYELRPRDLLLVSKVDMRYVVSLDAAVSLFTASCASFLVFCRMKMHRSDLYAVNSCHVAVFRACPFICCITLWCFMYPYLRLLSCKCASEQATFGNLGSHCTTSWMFIHILYHTIRFQRSPFGYRAV